MIASKIDNPKKSSGKAARVAGVVDYITEPENVNSIEKCIHGEAVNFLSHDLKSQKAEMTALAQEAVRSKDPIDHWVLSWKENERPTPEQAREAAAIFIKQCGLEGHQYVYGLHDDTDNVHVHIAVNRVHPDTGKVVKINKGFDKEAGHQAIAIIEKVQGWSVEENARYRVNEKAELVIDPATKRPQIFEKPGKQQEPTAKAKAMEIQTGEKSAQRVGIEQAAPIIAQAQSWKELHASMAAAGMQYQRKGSGAVVQVGDEFVKASSVTPKASLSALQKRFGPYQPPQEIKPNEYHHHTPKAKEPHPVEAGKEPGNRLRSLSKCDLAVIDGSVKARRAGVLHIDVRAGGRSADGLRRDAGRAIDSKLTPQPLKENQPGWKEYIAIRDGQRAAKAGDTLALQKSHGDERTALAVKQKAERDGLFSGNWKGKGEAKNVLKSVIATQQAAEKLEQRERHAAERKALQAQYKPLPQYKDWKEQPQIVGMKVRPLLDQHITRDKQVTVAQTLRALSHSVDARKHITYQLDHKNVFRDEGRTIAVLDLKSDAGIAAALATAQQKFGNVLELTGSDEFKRNAVAVAVANNLTCKFADPELEKLREQLQVEQYQAAREAIRAERDRLAAEHLEKSKVKDKAQEAEKQPPVHPSTTHEAVPPALEAQQPVLLDREIPPVDHLADIHQQIEAAKAAAHRHSMLAHSTTTEADHDAQGGGVIVASNEQFVAVQQGQSVKLYQTIELAKRMTYDGIDTGSWRFAPGNELTRKNGKDGMRTLLIEEREHMQSEAKREQERYNDLGR